MDVRKAIETRRAYRSLGPIDITDDLIHDLARSASLAPSCFNKQPWNYVFVKDSIKLQSLEEAYSQGNEWANDASLVVAVLSSKEMDCVIKDREYFLFDTGLATMNMILRATELGMVAHPIAGFSPKKVRQLLDIPDEMTVIALLIIGKHSMDESNMTEKQILSEKDRPTRKNIDEFIHIDVFTV